MTTNQDLHFHKLTKINVIGDFDGDGKEDTIFQHNFSKLYNREIDSSADPLQVNTSNRDNVIKWFYGQESDVYLTINHSSNDTLHLGTAQGLYCLLNIGDNNSDGKDEVAFVVDYCDYSQANNCKIYTLCKGKWNELQQYAVHEDAFAFSSDTSPRFKGIKGYLENRNGNWFYLDYDKDILKGNEKMTPLKLNKCK